MVSLTGEYRGDGRSQERIAVFRALPGLGDMLCLVPALRALRAARPEAHITLIGLPSVHWFAARFGAYLDGFIPFPGWPGLVEQPVDPHRTAAFLTAMQGIRFDLALQMHGSGGITNPLVILLGARRVAGFYETGQYCPDPDAFLPVPAHTPEPLHHLRLLEYLGIPARGAELEFPITAAERDEAGRVMAMHGLQPGDYICVHPGSSTAARRWQFERFAAVADALAERGYRIVLTGAESESAVMQAVADAMRRPVVDLAGQTSLGGLAALLEVARLQIANDTGVSHLAAAVQLPSVLISFSDPARWAPIDRRLHRPLHDPTPAAVLQQADDLLRLEARHAA
ncbi:MAG: glycosyltransferase family 9 protein [Thermomicrobia bacterium]|nr:glycosyltransferase family 9 protein [Thermomicrobia bacterium]MCA1723246.1 glycosyltransferase family 9 protein [Thermomicrobia bacterium]